MALAPGTRLGPYEVLSPLGAGGMGEVFRARDTRLGRDVAVKVLPDHLAHDPKALARFESEARAVAALSHPNILALYDVGRIDGTSFAVTELLDGETLRSALRHGALPQKKALEVAAQLADGLAAAHEKRIVHRDLKPENVFVTRDGHAKLLDFGLARHSIGPLSPYETRSPTEPDLTDAGTVLGTVAYMSPEQARGLPVDPRSDQFSLGIVLYEMLAGRRPFRGESAAETLAAILREEPEPIDTLAPTTPAAIRLVVDRCLAKDPEGRYDSTRDLARDLAAWRQGLSTPSGRRKAPAPSRRRLLLAGAAAAALLAVGVAIGVLATRALPPRGPTKPPAFQYRKLIELGISYPEPALSPDGATLVYETEKSPGDVDLFSLRVGGYNPVNLTADHAEYDGEAAFSPDGGTIAFRSEREGGGVFLMGATGESPKRLTTFGYHPAWFPDGRRIVFSTASFSEPQWRFGQGALFTVDLPSGEPVKLFDAFDATLPRVSPNGLRIAFGGGRHGKPGYGIYTIPAKGLAAGEEPVLVYHPERRDLAWAPFWSADGSRLFFGSESDGARNLWSVPIEERSGVPRGGRVRVGLPASQAGPFSTSADGLRIAWASTVQAFTAERVSLDADTATAAGDAFVIARGRWSVGAVSADGALACFSGPGDEVWTIRTDGTGVRRLTEDARANWPQFSADGRRVFVQANTGGAAFILSVGVDGRDPREEVRNPVRENGAFQPYPSPDGRSLAIYSWNEGPRILPLPQAPGTLLPPPLPALDEKRFFWPTSWSRDSRLLAGTASPRDGGFAGSEIWIHDVASGSFRRVRASGQVPRFLPDGRRLLFKEGGRILVLEIDTGRTQTAFTPRPGTRIERFAVAPDGRSLYLDVWSPRSEVWLAEVPPTPAAPY